VAFNIVEPLLEIMNGNKYILVAIDHYLKLCETKVVVDHNAKPMARFLEDEFIYRFGESKYILTDNGFEWSTKFD
jgi:transposase-like protein